MSCVPIERKKRWWRSKNDCGRTLRFTVDTITNDHFFVDPSIRHFLTAFLPYHKHSLKVGDWVEENEDYMMFIVMNIVIYIFGLLYVEKISPRIEVKTKVIDIKTQKEKRGKVRLEESKIKKTIPCFAASGHLHYFPYQKTWWWSQDEE